MTKFIHDADVVDYVPAADVVAGQVVEQNDLLGVALKDIKAGEKGALRIRSVFEWPKDTGAGTAIAFGETLYWDNTGGFVTLTVGSNKRLGKAVQDVGDSDDKVKALLIP